MGMRITNGIINSNAKINIMINKEYADKTNTMVATGQKITRPSDDPVIAIRNLRLNSNIDELTQYKTKNIPDADAWLKTTGTALDQTHQVLKDIHDNLTTGASDQNTAEDRMKIMENLSKLRDQIYASGNADYAGRTVFTGYRTGESLTYLEKDESTRYNIVETFDNSAVEKMQYVKGSFDVDRNNLSGTTESAISGESINRLRLAYDKLDYPQKTTDSKAGAPLSVSITGKTKNSTTTDINYPVTVVNTEGMTQEQIDNIYTKRDASGGTGPDVILIANTGELIMKDSVAATLQADGSTFNITYAKTEFNKGDLRPEHYFACTSWNTTDDKAKKIEYNYDDTKTPHVPDFQNQKISYEVAFNQKIDINTNANEVYTHDIGRDVDDLMKATQDVIDIEDKMKKLEDLKSDSAFYTAHKATIDDMITAAAKEFSYRKENMQKMFSQAMTKFDGYMDAVNLANTRVGSMGQRLELTKERVTEQLNNFKELSDENINIDLTESAIDLKSAQVALEAAQTATARISQQSLLNYL